jgi:hypothetical protein
MGLLPISDDRRAAPGWRKESFYVTTLRKTTFADAPTPITNASGTKRTRRARDESWDRVAAS